MTEISAAMVKELREATQAGIMDAKRALQETEGDFDEAVKILRERGMASAAKRAGRETTEGVILGENASSTATLVAIGCETEPVSKNEDFQAFAKAVLAAVHEGGEEAVPGLEEERVALSGRLGENIRVVDAKRMTADDGESFAHYIHKGSGANNIGVLLKVKGGSPELAKRLAMHIASGRPTYRSRDQVPAELVAAERDIFEKKPEVESKPPEVREKIVEGMLNKNFFGEAVLDEQPWIHDTALSVSKALAEGGLELVDYVWFSVG